MHCSRIKKVTIEDDSNTDKERFGGVSLYKWSCCGKVYKNRVALAIHLRKVHVKCSCHLSIAVAVLQCNECEIKYPVKTKLHRHLATRHHGEVFGKVATKNLEARIEVDVLF